MTGKQSRVLACGLCIAIVGALAAAWWARSNAAEHELEYRRALARTMTKARDLDVACAQNPGCDQQRLRADKETLAAALAQTENDGHRAMAGAKLATSSATIVGSIAALILLWLVLSVSKSTKQDDTSALEETLRDRLEQLYSERRKARDNARFAAYGEIAAGLSHGLKTPLASVRAIVQLVQAKLGADHEAQDSLDEILDQVDELVGQINRFLTTMGSGDPATSRTTASKLIGPLEERYRHGDATRQISFVTSVGDAIPDVLADSELVEMALRNLIDNALYFARDGTEVTLAASSCPAPGAVGLERKPPPGETRDREWIELAVIDSGRGIPKDIADGKEGESSRPGGSGLGVAIARRVAARHGGTLLIDAVEGKGTCARFILPPAIDDTDTGA